MDTNGGRAAPCPGRELIVAIQAALNQHPDARFEGNQLGNVVATVDGEYVGYIDVRDLMEGLGGGRWTPKTDRPVILFGRAP